MFHAGQALKLRERHKLYLKEKDEKANTFPRHFALHSLYLFFTTLAANH